MITTEFELQNCIDFCMKYDCVAVDTEFVWEKTFFPNLGLIQLCANDTPFLIDTVALNDLTKLGSLLNNDNVVKIFHDAPQDIKILQRATGVITKNIFDTKIASGFAGETTSISLAKVIENYCNILLPKTESRTNWLARPLSAKQIEYAIDDVIYMPKVYQLLKEKIQNIGNYDYFSEEMKNLEQIENFDDNLTTEKLFNKLVYSHNLSNKQTIILRNLVYTREKMAIEKNLPRNFIVSNEMILEIVKKSDDENFSCETLAEILQNKATSFAKHAIECIKNANYEENNIKNDKNKNLFDKRKLKTHADRILHFLRFEASKKQIDVACIASRQDVEKLVLHYFETDKELKECPLTKSWRYEILKKLVPIIKTK